MSPEFIEECLYWFRAGVTVGVIIVVWVVLACTAEGLRYEHHELDEEE